MQLPVLKVEGTNIPPHLQRAIITFEKTMIEFRYAVENSDRLLEQIHNKLGTVFEGYDGFQAPVHSGHKAKKYSRMQENYVWNVWILRGQMELLEMCKRECKQAITQVCTITTKLWRT